MGWNLFGGCGGSKHFVRRDEGNVRNVRKVGNRAAGEVAEGNVGNVSLR
jgi:hypothetical protein